MKIDHRRKVHKKHSSNMIIGTSSHCAAANLANSKGGGTDFSIAAIMARGASSREPSERSLSKCHEREREMYFSSPNMKKEGTTMSMAFSLTSPRLVRLCYVSAEHSFFSVKIIWRWKGEKKSEKSISKCANAECNHEKSFFPYLFSHFSSYVLTLRLFLW